MWRPVPILRAALHLLRRFWAELLAVVALAALIIGVNPERLGKVFSEIQWRIALLMIPVVLAVYVFRGLAWWVALRGIGEHISVRRTMLIELAGQVMIFLPLGDLTRVAMVRSADHDEGVGAITATVVLQELSFMLLMSLGAVPQLVQRPNVALLLLAVILAFFGVFALILWKPAYERAIRIVESVKFFRRFDEQLQDIRPAFLLLCRPRILSGVIVFQALAALGSFLLFDLALLAIGLNVGYVAAVFVLGVSYTFSAISFLPLGLGAFEGVLTVILITYGIPAAAGAGSALLFRGYNDILMALIGLPCLLYLRRRQHTETGRGVGST
jgi:uncharacterized protein (TIRG00374 family)